MAARTSVKREPEPSKDQEATSHCLPIRKRLGSRTAPPEENTKLTDSPKRRVESQELRISVRERVLLYDVGQKQGI